MLVTPKYMQQNYGISSSCLCTSKKYAPYYTKSYKGTNGKRVGATFNLSQWLKNENNTTNKNNIESIIFEMEDLFSIPIRQITDILGITYQSYYLNRIGIKKLIKILYWFYMMYPQETLKLMNHYNINIDIFEQIDKKHGLKPIWPRKFKIKLNEKDKNKEYIVTQIDYKFHELHAEDINTKEEIFIDNIDNIKLYLSSGFIDKNNNEIFEGDLVSIDGKRVIVTLDFSIINSAITENKIIHKIIKKEQ